MGRACVPDHVRDRARRRAARALRRQHPPAMLDRLRRRRAGRTRRRARHRGAARGRRAAGAGRFRFQRRPRRRARDREARPGGDRQGGSGRRRHRLPAHAGRRERAARRGGDGARADRRPTTRERRCWRGCEATPKLRASSGPRRSRRTSAVSAVARRCRSARRLRRRAAETATTRGDRRLRAPREGRPSVDAFISLGELAAGDASAFATARLRSRARSARRAPPSRPNPATRKRFASSALGVSVRGPAVRAKRATPQGARRVRADRSLDREAAEDRRALRDVSRGGAGSDDRARRRAAGRQDRALARAVDRTGSARFGREHVQVPAGRRGHAGEDGLASAAGLPKRWIASFCSDRQCAPFRTTVALPASGVKVIEFQVIPQARAPAPPTIRVDGDGASATVRVATRGPRVGRALAAVTCRTVRYGRRLRRMGRHHGRGDREGRSGDRDGCSRKGRRNDARVRGGSEHFHALPVERKEHAVGTRVVVVEYHPPRTVIVAEA